MARTSSLFSTLLLFCQCKLPAWANTNDMSVMGGFIRDVRLHFGIRQMLLLHPDGVDHSDDDDLALVNLVGLDSKNGQTAYVINRNIDLEPNNNVDGVLLLPISNEDNDASPLCQSYILEMFPTINRSEIHHIVPSVCIDYLTAADLRLDSQIYAYESRGDQTIVLKEVYAIKKARKVVSIVGNWSGTNGLVLNSNESFYERRSDLRGVTLTSVILTSNFAVLRHDKLNDTHYAKPEGMFIDMAETLAHKLNFTLDYVTPAHGHWGSECADGRWTGMVGMLARGEADVCTTELTVTLGRSRVVDFTVTLERDVVTLTMAVPDGLEIDVWVYADIFRWQCWLALLGLLLALATTLFLIRLCGLESFHDNSDSELFSWVNAVSVEAVLLLQRDYCISKARLSSRIVFQVSCLFCFLTFAFYTGVLTSLMTSRPQPVPIQNLQQVLSSPVGYKIIMKSGTSHLEFARSSPPGSPLREIYERLIEGKDDIYFETREEIMEKMFSDPRYLYFGSKMYLFGMSGLEAVNLRDKMYGNLAFGLPKDSEFRGLFNHHLIHMEEAGVLRELKREWLHILEEEKGVWLDDDGHGGDDQGDEALALGYDNVLMPFVILSFGIITSIGFMFSEAAACTRVGLRRFHKKYLSSTVLRKV